MYYNHENYEDVRSDTELQILHFLPLKNANTKFPGWKYNFS